MRKTFLKEVNTEQNLEGRTELRWQRQGRGKEGRRAGGRARTGRDNSRCVTNLSFFSKANYLTLLRTPANPLGVGVAGGPTGWIIQPAAQAEPQLCWVLLSSWVRLLLPAHPPTAGQRGEGRSTQHRALATVSVGGGRESHWVKLRAGDFLQ